MATQPVEQQAFLTPAAPKVPEVVPAQNAQLVKNPMEALKSLLNADGELDFQNMNISDRLTQFADYAARSNCNLPLWESNLLTQCPIGTTLVPLPIFPKKQDAWRGEDARKMKLKDGYVEPSADFLLRIAAMLDIKLVKVFEGVTNDTGSAMYECKYNAYLMLPNGTLLSVEGEGKAQELYNSQGKQAHIQESTRKKAKRNAIKALLGIPTSMLEEDFDRPWVLLRPVFRAGLSDQTDAILADQKALADRSREMLFPTNKVDVAASESTPSFEELKAALESANTPEELEAVRKRLAAAALTGDIRAQLRVIYKARKTLLETGEVTLASQLNAPDPQPAPAAPIPQSVQAPGEGGGY